MTTERFEEGAIVELKSGGPKMTVQSFGDIGAAGKYICQWFAGKKLETGRFTPKQLKRSEDAPNQSESQA